MWKNILNFYKNSYIGLTVGFLRLIFLNNQSHDKLRSLIIIIKPNWSIKNHKTMKFSNSLQRPIIIDYN
jgi:hypothetical protein